MERLTKSGPISGKDINKLLDATNENQFGRIKAYYKLQEYEDLEEHGRLLKLPCKVGDIVNVKLASYCEEKYAEAKVVDFTHFISCGFCAVVTSKHFDKQNIPFTEFGKTIFLTKSEAEAKLKELRGGENG